MSCKRFHHQLYLPYYFIYFYHDLGVIQLGYQYSPKCFISKVIPGREAQQRIEVIRCGCTSKGDILRVCFARFLFMIVDAFYLREWHNNTLTPRPYKQTLDDTLGTRETQAQGHTIPGARAKKLSHTGDGLFLVTRLLLQARWAARSLSL